MINRYSGFQIENGLFWADFGRGYEGAELRVCRALAKGQVRGRRQREHWHLPLVRWMVDVIGERYYDARVLWVSPGTIAPAASRFRRDPGR